MGTALGITNGGKILQSRQRDYKSGQELVIGVEQRMQVRKLLFPTLIKSTNILMEFLCDRQRKLS